MVLNKIKRTIFSAKECKASLKYRRGGHSPKTTKRFVSALGAVCKLTAQEIRRKKTETLKTQPAHFLLH